MKILRAQKMGHCFGVRDALAMAEREAEAGPITILGRLVHNRQVNQRLAAAGVAQTPELGRVPTRRVLITAHGVSNRRRDELERAGLDVADASCPLVRLAHDRLSALVDAGYHPLVIGKPGHVEVVGLVGDFDGADVVLDEADLASVAPRARFGVVAQTTQPIGRVRRIVDAIRTRFPRSDVRFVDTVCRPTKERQTAAIALAARVDIVVVIGDPASNNTRELAETCRTRCRRVHRVADPDGVDETWFDGGDLVGITAGTSTPHWVIDAVEERLRRIADVLEATPCTR